MPVRVGRAGMSLPRNKARFPKQFSSHCSSCERVGRLLQRNTPVPKSAFQPPLMIIVVNKKSPFELFSSRQTAAFWHLTYEVNILRHRQAASETKPRSIPLEGIVLPMVNDCLHTAWQALLFLNIKRLLFGIKLHRYLYHDARTELRDISNCFDESY